MWDRMQSRDGGPLSEGNEELIALAHQALQAQQELDATFRRNLVNAEVEIFQLQKYQNNLQQALEQTNIDIRKRHPLEMHNKILH